MVGMKLSPQSGVILTVRTKQSINLSPLPNVLKWMGTACSMGIRAHNSALVKVAKHLYDLIKPSLPSNLDEAAEEIMPISYGSLEVDCYGGSEPVYSREQMVEMFKAGVELMAGQFKKIEGELVDWYETNGVEYCYGIRADESFEVPEGFYIKKK